MIIAEHRGRCRQLPGVLGGEGEILGTKDMLSWGPVDTPRSHVYRYICIVLLLVHIVTIIVIIIIIIIIIIIAIIIIVIIIIISTFSFV